MDEYFWLIKVLFCLLIPISGYVFLKIKRVQKRNQKQSAGKNSINIQAGRNININNGIRNDRK